MPSLSKNVAHKYDPNVVFHTHNSNMPHISQWIEEMITLTENNINPLTLSNQSEITTDHLVQALQRYDAMFKELMKQNNLFNEKLTNLFGKVICLLFNY